MIEIDGSHGEGGGQIIRTSLTLSAITQKPVTISNIRAKRPNPGLQMQHLTCAKAVRSICRGTLEDAELKSTKLIFHPGEIVGGKYEFNIGTAGSVTLVAQTIIPILLQSEKKSNVRIIGGTHVMKSPGYDYFEKVFVPAIHKFGVKIETRMLKTGYYPKGGGMIEFEIEPSELYGCTDWPQEDKIKAIIRIAGLPMDITVREKKIFVQEDICDVFIRQDETLSVGNAVTAWNGYRGSYVLGEKGKRAEVVAQESLDELKKETKDVDKHLADQLLIYAALAKGESRFETYEITEHFRTNTAIIGKFVERKINYEEGRVIINDRS
ncbi:RNA 3'-phosphate cyclase [Candidatus Micrarchaeota archaeon]|nr:RNA 3'-phosphate cyclase [Candidatus Micrarchaeota archaeon]MBU1166756.1 RNA 3'-phosphate cyclase [Candidatus Micrarchaeota archaeon]MBU1887246.1 RNA 3'-phosphate cyclase [Candidatus Micrarchaeota archaeon]